MTQVQLEALEKIEGREKFEGWCRACQKSTPAKGTIWAAFYEGGDLHVAVVTPAKGLKTEVVNGEVVNG